MKKRIAAWTTLLPFALGLSVLWYRGPAHQWARAHAGDALAVAALVGLLGLVSHWSMRVRLVAVAACATVVEFAQLMAGAADRTLVVKLLVGSHFDPLDFVYYAAGLVLALILERLARRSAQG